MTWTRLDDAWTERADLAELDHSTRWHYLALIQFCSRTGRYDGAMRVVDARRCSDVDDPDAAHARLTRAGLAEYDPAARTLTLTQIDQHIPPPSVREESERARVRKERNRRHKNGDHSQCYRQRCALGKLDEPQPARPTSDPSPGGVSHVVSHVTPGRDRTGQDGDRTGREREASQGDDSRERIDLTTGEVLDDWPTVAGSAPTRVECRQCNEPMSPDRVAAGHSRCASCEASRGEWLSNLVGATSTPTTTPSPAPSTSTTTTDAPGRPCADCGEPVTTPNRVRCPRCLAAMRSGSR